MGGSSSKSSTQVTNEFLTKVTNEMIVENSQKVQASSLNINKISARGSTFKNCTPLVFKQGIDSETIATGKMTEQNIQDLTSKLKSEASNAIENAATQQSGFLAPQFANSSSARTNLKNKVENIIQNTMVSKSVQDIFANANNKNDADFSDLYMECEKDPDKKGLPCNNTDQSGCALVVDQNIKAKVMAEAIGDKLTQALSSTIAEATVDNKSKNTSTQENTGVDAITGQLFGFLGAWGAAGPIISVCCCCIIVIIIVLLMMGKKPSVPNSKLVNQAMNKALVASTV